jgi:cell wall-associated NlpC family hydrolase
LKKIGEGYNMKRILVFLCVFLVFTSVVIFGCNSENQTTPTIIDNNESGENSGEDGIVDIGEENFSPALVLTQYKVQATATVNIRAEASIGSEILGQLKKFDTLPLISQAENWYQVYYNHTPAYVSASYANVVQWNNHTERLVTGLEVLALTAVNIRQAPSTSGAVLGKLNRLEHLPLAEKYSSEWHKVIYQGQEAFVSAGTKYTRIYDPEKADAQVQNIIAEGKKVLGVPYEFGAQRLIYGGKINFKFTGKTFDCSSFAQYAFYRGAGIILKETSRSQSQEGILINEDELRAGDLIFMWSSARRYNTGIERIGHVAIYIGDNKILHTWGAGGVRIEEYSAGWRARFILARRMI